MKKEKASFPEVALLKDIAVQLNRLVYEQRLSQQEIAEKVCEHTGGIPNRVAVSRLLSAQSNPTVKTLARIIDAANCTITISITKKEKK